MDLDLLFDRRDRGDPPEWLACPGVLGPYLPPDQRRPVFGVLGRLRARARPVADDRTARAPGLYRRRADPPGVHADHHDVAEGGASDRPGAFSDLRDDSAR